MGVGLSAMAAVMSLKGKTHRIWETVFTAGALRPFAGYDAFFSNYVRWQLLPRSNYFKIGGAGAGDFDEFDFSDVGGGEEAVGADVGITVEKYLADGGIAD